MDIFNECKLFPNDERFSLVDQILRSSRSVAATIAKAFRKRRYQKMLVSKLTDADAEATETQVWLDFALDCGYLSQEQHEKLVNGYEEIGRMLGSMISNPDKFKPS